MYKLSGPRKPVTHDMRGCYVYGVTVDGALKYVGKGRGYRVREHLRIARYLNRERAAGRKIKTNRFYNRLAAAMRAGRTIGEIIFADGMTDEDAFALERVKIAEHRGLLWNVGPGGEGFDTQTARELWTPERRARQSEIAKRRWSDPQEREKHAATIKSQWEDPAYREHHVSKQRERWEKPGAKERGGETVRSLWADPEYRARVQEGRARFFATPEGKAVLSERNRKVALSRAAKRKQAA